MSKSPNRVLIIAIALLVIAVAIVAAISSTKSAVVFDRTTPVGSVQIYLNAVLSGKSEQAARMFSPGDACTAADIDRTSMIDNVRVLLLNSTIDGATAQVRVRVEIPSGSPFGEFVTEDHTFSLVHSGGKWLLTGIAWPLYDCVVMAK